MEEREKGRKGGEREKRRKGRKGEKREREKGKKEKGRNCQIVENMKARIMESEAKARLKSRSMAIEAAHLADKKYDAILKDDL
ncbi:MAG: hypothetical protein LBF40_03030 [Deltaproteobacteria bacterium]|jgi:hypothetical protein|nr:hypothetical protein [Deltaproteobacteria bacterium]